jgi:rubredoxin
MISEVTMYRAVCDRCGHEPDGTDFYAWADADSAVEAADGEGWEMIDDRHYCPECYIYDENGDPQPLGPKDEINDQKD